MNAIHARSQLRYWPTWLGLAVTNLDRNALSRQRQSRPEWSDSVAGGSRTLRESAIPWLRSRRIAAMRASVREPHLADDRALDDVAEHVLLDVLVQQVRHLHHRRHAAG